MTTPSEAPEFEFIEAVQNRPELWDVKNENYKMKEKKKATWEMLAKEHGMKGYNFLCLNNIIIILKMVKQRAKNGSICGIITPKPRRSHQRGVQPKVGSHGHTWKHCLFINHRFSQIQGLFSRKN
jgi:hypothetical protein